MKSLSKRIMIFFTVGLILNILTYLILIVFMVKKYGLESIILESEMLITSVVILTINIISIFGIYKYLKYKLVKRIEYIVSEVDNAVLESELAIELKSDEENDEITKLKSNINQMVYTVNKADYHMKMNDKKYSEILNTMSNGFIYLKLVKDENNVIYDAEIIEVNNATRVLYPNIEFEGKSLREIWGLCRLDFKDCIEILKQISCNKTTSCYTKEIMISEGVWVVLTVYCLSNGYMSIILNDISELKRYSEEMSYLANYDTLTSLLNRHNLFEYLVQLISRNEEFSILFIDLDNFKNINDTLGHNTGDDILRTVADILTDMSSEEIIVGRLGGDEFIVIKKGENNTEQINELAEKILNSLNREFRFNNVTFELKASVGISYCPQHTDDIFTLFQYADIAMYEGKKEGGNGYKTFSENMLEGLIIESKLKGAIEEQVFEVFFQPIYNIESKNIVAAEALIRWFTDDGMIPPDKFIPIAKKTGDIVEIDTFVLKQSCEFCKKIIDLGFKNFQVSVNISYRFLKKKNFIDIVLDSIGLAGINTSNIKLEITEDEIIDDTKYTISVLNNLRKHGIKVSLDDFGVGYSSFNHIKTLPLDTIKIDRSLLLSLEDDEKTLAIIDTLIKLSHTLELEVVCEGVECRDQLTLLEGIGCDKIQGYFISRPIPNKEFIKFIQKYN